jgi:hypothetical protein
MGRSPRVLLHKAIGAYLAVPCRFTQPREAVFLLAEGGSKIISKNPYLRVVHALYLNRVSGMNDGGRMTFEKFAVECPIIAQLALERFSRDQLVMVGTLRKDGWPRISPCEVDLAAGELFLGMMWQSTKALDLLRDPRLVVHSVTCDREGRDGDIKLYGRVLDIQDPVLRRTFQEAIRARIDWAPEEPEFHLFALDLERASYIKFGGGQQIMTWDPNRGFRQWTAEHA